MRATFYVSDSDGAWLQKNRKGNNISRNKIKAYAGGVIVNIAKISANHKNPVNGVTTKSKPSLSDRPKSSLAEEREDFNYRQK